MKDYILKQVEMIEREFTDIDHEELYNKVWKLINKNKDYTNLNEADKFDYLVDNILEENKMINKINKEIESSDRRLNRMEKQADKLIDEIKEIANRNSIYDIITFINTPLNRLKELNAQMNAEDDKRRTLEFMLSEEEK